MARADRIVRMYLRDRFLITTHEGKTFGGVLVDADDRTLVLAEVDSYSPDGVPTRVDNQLFLPRGDVAYMQRA